MVMNDLLQVSKPRLLTFYVVDQIDKVVNMGCEIEGVCPATWVETEDW